MRDVDGYAAQCRAEGKRAVPPVQFIDPVKEFCRRAGIRTKTEGDRFYLLGRAGSAYLGLADVGLAPRGQGRRC
jgi:hypothetical protein